MINETSSLPEVALDELQKMSLTDKAACFNSREGRPYHVLISQQFNRNLLEELCDMATTIRQIAKSKAGMDFLRSQLTHKTGMLYFSQPSSRTFLSFHSACQILGMQIVEVRDTSTSSEMKGETREDSIRTFSSFSDIIIMRSAVGGLAEKMAWMLSQTERPVPIVNAGSGKDQHPTQALLDVYTLRRSFEKRGGIDGKTVVFVGDLARGRTVRSLAYLLTNFGGVTMYFIAPPQLQVGQDVLDTLDAARIKYEIGHDLSKVITLADAIYMTRIQDEWDAKKGDSGRIDNTAYCFKAEHLELMQPHAILMHPLPRRDEIEVEVDRDPRAMYWRQVRNGMWVRAALILNIFGCYDNIRGYRGS